MFYRSSAGTDSSRPPRPVRRSTLGATFIGPSFVVAVAYVDPGNLATNVSAGARYGYALLWVIVMANLMAMLIQYLSAKLGLATGRNLAQVCRDNLPRPVAVGLWLQAEFMVIMTDLAEVVGGALALYLLFGIPIVPGALITGGVMLVILRLSADRRRRFEVVIGSLLSVVLLGFLYQTIGVGVDGPDAVRGLAPSFPDNHAALLAVGIVGATVMPHAIYLHSALTQGLIGSSDPAERRRATRSTLVDVLVALSVAGFINASILLGARSLAGTSTESLTEAFTAFEVTSGRVTALVFAVALLASGLAACCVGVYTGQVVVQGFIRRSVPIWLRRAISMVPALVILGLGMEPTTALVLSQVTLSFGIPFALYPLLRFTSDRSLMGDLVNSPWVTRAAVAAGALIVALNVYLVGSAVLGA